MPEPLNHISKAGAPKGMGKADERVLKIIRTAKENETAAAAFYNEAARIETDAAGKLLFQQLAVLERYHFARLSTLEESLRARDGYIKYEQQEPPSMPRISVSGTKLPETSTTMKILRQAAQREKEAENDYLQIADQIVDPDGHYMFSRLSEEEHLHFHILKEILWNLSHGGSWEWTIR